MSLRLCGAGFKFLVAACVGGPSPLLPGVRRPLAGVRQVGVALSHGCGRVSSPSGACGGLLVLDPRLVSLALVLRCASGAPRCVVPCFAMLRPAGLCCFLVRSAVLCRAAPCRAVVCRAVAWLAAPCCTAGVSCREVPCCGALHGRALRCGVPCCLVLCRVSLSSGVRWALSTALPAWGGVGAS